MREAELTRHCPPLGMGLGNKRSGIKEEEEGTQIPCRTTGRGLVNWHIHELFENFSPERHCLNSRQFFFIYIYNKC